MRGKTHPPYSAEYRRRIVDLYRNGRTPEQLAREFEPSAPTIREWCQQADRDAGGGDGGATSAEREELARLRRENRRLREEREILKKCMDRRRDASTDRRSEGAGYANVFGLVLQAFRLGPGWRIAHARAK